MQGSRILVVDDDRAHCDNLEDILTLEGYEPFSANTCAEAMSAAKQRNPQIALVDLKLPDGSGTTLLSQLKQYDPDLLCIIVSAYADLDSAVAALSEGAFHYLQKPLRAEELLAILHRAQEVLSLREERRHAQEDLKARNRELENINERLRRMVESSRGLASCSRSGMIGELLLKEFARTMSAQGGNLFMCEENGLSLAHSLDIPHAPSFIPFPLQSGSVFACAMETRSPLLIADIAREEHVQSSGWTGYADGSLLVFPLPDENGRIVAIVSLHNKNTPPFTPQDRELGTIFASITSEALRASRAIEALRHSEEQYRLLAENVVDVIWTLDLDLHITYISHSVHPLFGYLPEELLTKSVEILLTPDSFKDALKRYEKGSRSTRSKSTVTRAPQMLEFQQVRKDGTHFWAETKATILYNEQGNATGILGVTRDITARKQMEQEKDLIHAQLLHSQKIEGIGVLAGGIAHDFNNLLTTILGYLDFSMMDLGESHPVSKNLKQVHAAAMKAADLTRQLLLFSRKQPIVQAPININNAVNNMLKMLHRIISEDISIDIELKDDPWIVMADQGTIEQVIMNLAVNARDAMPAGGRLTIKTAHVVLSEADCKAVHNAKPGRFVCLSVTDTGIGMAQEIVDHIFEPFFTTKELGKGTGLGLAVVYGIIAQHKGWIDVASQTGQGTTLSIFLPAVPEAIDVPEQKDLLIENLRGNGERILLVEDQQEVREISSHILGKNNYCVLQACCARDALDLFEREHCDFHLVVSDVVLPDANGLTLVENLLSRKPGLKVLLCSGYTDEKSRWSIIHEKNYLFLQKPFRTRDLLDAVKKALESGKQSINP